MQGHFDWQIGLDDLNPNPDLDSSSSHPNPNSNPNANANVNVNPGSTRSSTSSGPSQDVGLLFSAGPSGSAAGYLSHGGGEGGEGHHGWAQDFGMPAAAGPSSYGGYLGSMSTAPHMSGPGGGVGAGSGEGTGGQMGQLQQHLGLEDMGEYDLGEYAQSSRKEPSSDV